MDFIGNPVVILADTIPVATTELARIFGMFIYAGEGILSDTLVEVAFKLRVRRSCGSK